MFNFFYFFFKYDILVFFFVNCPWFWLVLCYPDPGGRMKWIRIRIRNNAKEDRFFLSMNINVDDNYMKTHIDDDNFSLSPQSEEI